mmetsp:Transcript_27451/g.65393  ORF Transcript_27451/g.65393 Transcript_27451/m.65393 type:complete len:274 (-) Transcript_27451:756-1577(-)
MVPSCISRSPSRRGRICMAVRSHGRCMNREMRSTEVCTPFSLPSIFSTSLALLVREESARAAEMAEASASPESFSVGTWFAATPRSTRCCAQNRCSATKGQGTDATPALSAAPVQRVQAQCTASEHSPRRYWIGTERSTTMTLAGSSPPTSSLRPVPVTTPQMRFLVCIRGALRGMAANPGHSDTSTTRIPASLAASRATAASPSSSAAAMLPNDTSTGFVPAAMKRESSSVGVHPGSCGGTQKPARWIHRPQSAGLPRIRGENPWITGKSWW